jgi:hypothetical protein
MNQERLGYARIRFESCDRFLQLCNYSCQGGLLKIYCSNLVMQVLKERLDDLVLRFDHVQKIWINDVAIYDQPLPKINLPRQDDGCVVWKPNPKVFKQKFKVLNIQI